MKKIKYVEAMLSEGGRLVPTANGADESIRRQLDNALFLSGDIVAVVRLADLESLMRAANELDHLRNPRAPHEAPPVAEVA